MSESWMPGDDPPLARLIFDRDKFRDGEPYPLRIHEETRLRRLIERAALKAQIEALTSPMREHDWDGWRCSTKCPACNALSSIRARLAELEKP